MMRREIEISLPSPADAVFELHPQENTLALPRSHFRGKNIMNSMGRHVLRLVGIGAAVIVIPQLASASESESDAALKLAMGPTSAALKNQNVRTTSDNTVTECIPFEGTCPKPQHRSKR